MPPLERFDLTDRVVYWEKTGDDRRGRPKLAAPVQIPANIMTKRRDVMDATGTVISTDGDISSGCYLVDGSLIFEGGTADLPDDGIPTKDVYQLIMTGKVPDVKGRNVRYNARLVRYRDSFPTGSVE